MISDLGRYKIRMIRYLGLILILFSAACLDATTSGEYGFQMLKISSGASSSAQGGVGGYYANDAFSYFQNPSAPLFNLARMISIAQNYWIFDTKINSGSYQNSNGKRSFGFGYRYLDYGKLESRNDQGIETGEFHPMDMVVSVNFGYRITPDHYAGINAHALYEKIDASSSLGAAFDLGYTYLTPIKNLKLNAALKNLGKTSAMDEEVIELPVSGEIGLVHKFDFNSVILFHEFKTIKHIDDDQMKAVYGLKAEINQRLNLKIGYKFNYDSESFTTGFGVKLSKLAVDYAYIIFDADSEIDDVHVIGLTYFFK